MMIIIINEILLGSVDLAKSRDVGKVVTNFQQNLFVLNSVVMFI